MSRCAEYALAYATALGRTGVDLLSGGDSPAGLVGPRLYREVIWPAEQRLVTRLKRAVPQPVSLHICGDATPLLPAMAATGADVLEVDHAVDLGTACRRVGPGVTLWGNLDPVGVLAHGAPERVRAKAREAMAAVAAARHPRFVLSSGCTLAVETPPVNLEALVAEARLGSPA
jgi:uroporphyrinogen-III decarboxylase